MKDARTSAFIGCVKCGSKLSRVHLTSNKCPVCHEDLRSTTELNAIDALKKKAKTLQERIKAEEARLRKKSKNQVARKNRVSHLIQIAGKDK